LFFRKTYSKLMLGVNLFWLSFSWVVPLILAYLNSSSPLLFQGFPRYLGKGWEKMRACMCAVPPGAQDYDDHDRLNRKFPSSSFFLLAAATQQAFSRSFRLAWLGIGNLNHLFFQPELYRRPGELLIPFLFDENRGFASAGLGGAAVRCASFVPRRGARSNSDRAAPLVASATGFRLVKSFGIDRIAAPARAAGRGSVGSDGCSRLGSRPNTT